MQQNADILLNQLGMVFAADTGPVEALHDISLTVKAGAFVAVVGPSGCGKSTLLRLAGGLLAPTSGSVQVGTMDAEQARLARKVSFVFQQPVLLPWYTAQQNVELPLKLFGLAAGQRRAAAQHMLQLVGLYDFARAYPHQLSGGMQQRVAIARALAFEPAVLLLDEPFGALDEITRERLNSELLQIWSSTRPTVLFVTHSLSEAAFLADRVLILSAQPGHLVADVAIDLPRPRTVELLVEDAFLQCVAGLRRQLQHSFVQVEA